MVTLVSGAHEGAVTMNVIRGDCDGPTFMNVVDPIGVAVQPCGTCSASRTHGSVALPECVRRTVTWSLWPGTNSRGASTTTCRAPAVCAIEKDPRRGRFASAEESPRYTR